MNLTLTTDQVLAYHKGEPVTVYVPMEGVPEGKWKLQYFCNTMLNGDTYDIFVWDYGQKSVKIKRPTPLGMVKCREEWRGCRIWGGMCWVWNITYRDGSTISIEKCNPYLEKQTYYKFQPASTIPTEFMREYMVWDVGVEVGSMTTRIGTTFRMFV